MNSQLKSALWVLDDTRFDQHACSGAHPERPERLAAARAGVLRGVPDGGRIGQIAGRLALPTELGRVHTRAYLDELELRLSSRTAGFLDADTYFCEQTRDIAMLAAGGTVDLVERMLDDGSQSGIALVRPPGHHACAEKAMGFCLLNNVAIAAAHLRAKGLERIAIVDWDVHHGNGTEQMFWDEASVLFVSLHQRDFYPGTGNAADVGGESAKGCTVNVPLPAGSGPPAFGSTFRELILPILRAFRPSWILVSAGFDADARDPLGGLELSAPTFGAMTAALRALPADGDTTIPVALVLEGGYDCTALEEGLAACTAALTGRPFVFSEATLAKGERSVIDECVRVQRAFWPDLGAAPTRSVPTDWPSTK